MEDSREQVDVGAIQLEPCLPGRRDGSLDPSPVGREASVFEQLDHRIGAAFGQEDVDIDVDGASGSDQ